MKSRYFDIVCAKLFLHKTLHSALNTHILSIFIEIWSLIYKESGRRIIVFLISEVFSEVSVNFCFIFFMKVRRVIST